MNESPIVKTILIVDDEPDMVYALRMQLEAEGYRVLTAGDGREGLERVRKDRPDLVVLDLMLPKMDGYRVCRMLKFDQKFCDVPIIMFTARAQESDEKTGYEVGADAYVTKPFEPRVLLDTIRRFL